jgi:methionine-rich copper-binding protein CopC
MSIKHMVAAVAMTVATAFSSSAFAHAKLEASSPTAGTVLAVTPNEVRLRVVPGSMDDADARWP